MKLLKFENFELSISEEALLVKSIRMLWNQDRSSKKEKFYQQMSYLYFMIDPRSSYSYIINEEDRKEAIISQEGLPSDFKPSPLLKEAMEVYKKLNVTPSQKLLNSALKAAHTVSTFLEDPNILKEEDDKGKPKHSVSEITRALKDVEGIVTSLQNLQKKVDQELSETTVARGSQELTIGDLGLD